MKLTSSALHAVKSAAALASDGLILGQDGHLRCFWAGHDPLYIRYHDEEWGLPTADDRRIFEKLCLEGFQSGLAWITVLRKRAAFRAAFHDFDFHRLAAQNAAAVTAELIQNTGIIRHRGKIAAVFNNARCAVRLAEEKGSLSAYLHAFLPPDAAPAEQPRAAGDPAQNAAEYAMALAKDLKKRGFAFFGPTTAYAFMQALGMVNDHSANCCCHAKTQAAQKAFYAALPR